MCTDVCLGLPYPALDATMMEKHLERLVKDGIGSGTENHG